MSEHRGRSSCQVTLFTSTTAHMAVLCAGNHQLRGCYGQVEGHKVPISRYQSAVEDSRQIIDSISHIFFSSGIC